MRLMSEATYDRLVTRANTLLMELTRQETVSKELGRKVGELQEREQKLILRLGLMGIEVVERPERVVPARIVVRKVKR